MANILLLDPTDVARKAMQGILARGNHRLACVATAQEAREFIATNVVVDLVFVELKLEGEGGLGFVERMQGDCLLKLLPIVIYTAAVDRPTVQRALALKVQNFLVKPYRDDLVFAEVAKATANPWRNRHFEEQRSFCATMGYTPEELRRMLERLRGALAEVQPPLLRGAEAHLTKDAFDRLATLAEEAETAGAWGVVDCVGELQEFVKKGFGPTFAEQLASLDFAARLITRHLDPEFLPEGFLSHEELNAKEEAQARAVWSDAPAQGRCPVVPWAETLLQCDKLTSCPVIDTVAAGFQMAATGHPSSLMPIMDLVEKDPGLATHVLAAAQSLKHAVVDEFASVDDARIAVNLLGEKRLTVLAGGLVTVEERRMHLPPFTWSQFWTFQVGMANMARYVCGFLERPSLESRAYTAGLLHDIGRLLLVRLHPLGFQAIFDYARRERIPLREAEQKFLGGTTAELAVHFATKHGLPKPCVNVMRWIDDPAAATEDADLVAILALSRELCWRNQFGWNGETLPAEFAPLEETAAWRVLGPQVFTGFNVAKFEAKVHAGCLVFKQQLQGQLEPVGA